MRLCADRSRVEEDLRAHQHHRPGRLRIPLIPANADAERRTVWAAPHLETRVTGPEVEFLLVTGAVGNVALAIDAGDFPVGADHREAVVMVGPIQLEKARRDPDLQLLRELLHRADRRVLGSGLGGREQALILDPAEVWAFEQFWGKHDLGTLVRRLAHELADGADIRVEVVREGELQRSDGQLGHWGTCWEMQWKLPPPVRMWSARSPIATRSGMSA